MKQKNQYLIFIAQSKKRKKLIKRCREYGTAKKTYEQELIKSQNVIIPELFKSTKEGLLRTDTEILLCTDNDEFSPVFGFNDKPIKIKNENVFVIDKQKYNYEAKLYLSSEQSWCIFPELKKYLEHAKKCYYFKNKIVFENMFEPIEMIVCKNAAQTEYVYQKIKEKYPMLYIGKLNRKFIKEKKEIIMSTFGISYKTYCKSTTRQGAKKY